MKAVLAIDLGATSGRAVLGFIKANKLIIREIKRFSNTPIKVKGLLCWDVEVLFSHILDSIKTAKEAAEIVSVGIDTWGVDFALLDEQGKLLALPVHYRDERTRGILTQVAEFASLSDLYGKTGNQLMEINTLFQLMKTKSELPDKYFKADQLLLMPDYFNYLLTGKAVVEKSIASTTQMLNPLTQDWNQEVLSLFEITDAMLPNIVKEGHRLGKIKPEYQLGSVEVINVCEHDTASAIASIPKVKDPVLYISSGTWSLIGTELKHPILTKEAFEGQFTNELGHDSSVTFLKNCTGLWIVEELRRAFQRQGQTFEFADITTMVEAVSTTVPIIDTESPEFSQPGDMIHKIQAFCRQTQQNVPQAPGELFACAYHSLASQYKLVIEQLESLTHETYEEIYFMGGGSKSAYFTQLVANMTNKPCITGLSEATAIGNIIVQLIAQGDLKDMVAAKALVQNSFEFQIYTPKKEGT